MPSPDAASVAAGWFGTQERLNPCRAGREEQALEDSEIQTFILEGEGQMPFKGRMRRVPGSQDAPGTFLEHTMARANGGEGPRQRHGESICSYQALYPAGVALSGRRRS